MSKRRAFPVSQSRFRAEEWHITEDELDQPNHQVNETLFTVGNGYYGVRGSLEEGSPSSYSASPGCFLNGFYERHRIKYPEVAYGFAEFEDTMLNISNPLPVHLTLLGGETPEAFSVDTGRLGSHVRSLDLKSGVLNRKVDWTAPSGRSIRITTQRVAHLVRTNLMLQEYKVEAVNFSGQLRISSFLNSQVGNATAGNDPRVGSNLSSDVLQTLVHEDRSWEGHSAQGRLIARKTKCSELTYAACIASSVKTSGDGKVEWGVEEGDLTTGHWFQVDLKEGETVTLTKAVAYADSREEGDCVERAYKVVGDCLAAGIEPVMEEHRDHLKGFWEMGDVEIMGDPYLQQGMHFNCFHLLQSTGKDGRTNIAAKGLTGEGYGGHYFWDTEVYIMPFFLSTRPEVARSLLEFRHSILDGARKRARDLNISRGALFPWRTICGGECSSYFPAGTAQYHINADVAYAVKAYYDATEDVAFMLEKGIEMVFETARLWIQLGTWVGTDFQIHTVTGPDEYTAIVNNNYYTNIMAQANLKFATWLDVEFGREHPEELQRIKDKIGLQESELAEMERCGENMFLPRDNKLGIHPQDDSFLSKRDWDWENTPESNYPLLMNYHPLVIYQHKVCKQADLILALYHLPHNFTKAEKRANFDFYEPVTTHDSSLSTAIFSVIAAEVGYEVKSYQYFMSSARMDLDNIHHNAQHGLHAACMGGTWMAVVTGFGGMRTESGSLSFDPICPTEWEGYKFKICWKGAVLQVEVGPSHVEYLCISSSSPKPKVVFVHGKDTQVVARVGRPVRLQLSQHLTRVSSCEFDGAIVDVDCIIENLDEEHWLAWESTLNPLLESQGVGLITRDEYEGSVKHSVTLGQRFKGLSDFLSERGINLPRGKSEDEPGTNSLCGLGNQKLENFRATVKARGPRVKPAAIDLIKDLRASGIKVGAVSYSKNAIWLLKLAGLLPLFDAVVDGKQMAVAGLKGKPQADIFVSATEKVGIAHGRTVVVVDDATGYGSEAFKHFSFVICTGCSSEDCKPDKEVGSLEGVDTEVIEEWIVSQKSPTD